MQSTFLTFTPFTLQTLNYLASEIAREFLRIRAFFPYSRFSRKTLKRSRTRGYTRERWKSEDVEVSRISLDLHSAALQTIVSRDVGFSSSLNSDVLIRSSNYCRSTFNERIPDFPRRRIKSSNRRGKLRFNLHAYVPLSI